ncbi:MAG TPA: ATP-dependent helicase, partial [Aquabacterium sp.]|nr:ATP-dependent helicase [Aquabacterium sp.]
MQTLTRGDGVLGLRAVPGFGPRSTQVTVARVDWLYTTDVGLNWETPAPTKVLNARPKPTEVLRGAWSQRVTLQRDLVGEADARDALWASGLRPLPAEAIQWRSPTLADEQAIWWSLPEETHFADFWADQVPRLQAAGWSIVVWPGFAHQSVEVDAWRIVIDPDTGEEAGRELVAPLGPRVTELGALTAPRREGSWLLSLGVEVEGETLDLAPML